MSVPLFYIGLAGVPANIARWWHVLQLINNHPYVSHTFALVSAVGLSFYSPIKNHFAPRISVSLLPTSGARPEIDLRVTNNGAAREFYAQCELLSLKNSPNALAKVTYSLKWDMSDNKTILLGKNESANLVIAKGEHDHENATATMELVGLYGRELKQYEWARWNTSPQENLPEYTIKISILSDGTKAPLERLYMLRPKTYYGPLEMLEVHA